MEPTHRFCCSKGHHQNALIDFVEHNLKNWLPHALKIHFKAGQIIFYHHHRAFGVYILIEGQIELIQSSGHSKKHCGQSRLIGLNHLISNTPHCATCIAKENVTAFFIPKIEILSSLSPQYSTLLASLDLL